MDVIVDFLVNVLFYRIGFVFLKVVSFGKFKGGEPYYIYLVALVGLGVVIACSLVVIYVRGI
jgi:hypothetical protein